MASKAQTVTRITAYALALLCVAAGIPKIMQMPQELGFLSSIGLTAIGVSVLGVVQLAGGILLLWSRSRLAGALLAALALIVSSAAIFASGNSTFGLVSLLPLVVAIIVIYIELKGARRNSASSRISSAGLLVNTQRSSSSAASRLPSVTFSRARCSAANRA